MAFYDGDDDELEEEPQEHQGFAPKKVFVDNDFEKGQPFCTRLLECGEFNTYVLKKFVSRGSKSLGNLELARLVAQDVAFDNQKALELMTAYCDQKRKWLHFRVGSCTSVPTAGSARDFLTQFGGADAWYGPFAEGKEGCAYYVRAKQVYHFHMSDEKLRTRKLRWHVVARLCEDHVSFHWDGFTLNEDNENPLSAASSFPFWKHIPGFAAELCDLVGGTWSLPHLGPIILDDFWDAYRESADYHWRDNRIRAERHGVAIGAHSSGVSEIDITGIAALAETLAKSAVTALGDHTQARLDLATKAVLRTLIKEFGPKSYELRIDRVTAKSVNPFELDDDQDGEDKVPATDRLFRAHCYFGGKPAEAGQDGFQHLNCWSNYGGSHQALTFLLPHALRRAQL